MHSFVSCLMHCVFATKERRPLIKPDLQQRLWPYLGGIARKNKMKALVVGGLEPTDSSVGWRWSRDDESREGRKKSGASFHVFFRPWRGLGMF